MADFKPFTVPMRPLTDREQKEVDEGIAALNSELARLRRIEAAAKRHLEDMDAALPTWRKGAGGFLVTLKTLDRALRREE